MISIFSEHFNYRYKLKIQKSKGLFIKNPIGIPNECVVFSFQKNVYRITMILK